MKSEQLIKDLLSQQESERLEFKESVRKESIGKTICSFLNHRGGQLLIGVSDNKTIVGVNDVENAKEELETYLVEEIVPEAPVMVSVEIYDEKPLLLLKVWEGSKQPYIFEGIIYARTGERTHKATSKEISGLIQKRQENDIHWERQIALGVEIDDLDMLEVKKMMAKEAIASLKDAFAEPIDFLSHYGLCQNGGFTNAAVILFAKNPARFIPQARVRIAYLKGEKTEDVFTDDKVLEGNIFQNIEAIQKFLENNLAFVRKFDETQWVRSDGYVYPMVALREGVLNALIHREYGKPSSSLSIIIYPDRLEITNTGKSPYKPSELKKNHLSMPYNPDIAQIVFMKGYIEKIGRGTLKIIEACKKAGLKTPVWEIGEHTIKLTFFNEENGVNHRKEGIVDKPVIGGATDGATDGAFVKIVGEAFFANTTSKVRENLVKLLQTIGKTEGYRAPDYIRAVNVSERTMERYIQQLKEAGLVEFRGEAAQTGGYFLTEKSKKQLEP